jgi:hypothetical protein
MFKAATTPTRSSTKRRRRLLWFAALVPLVIALAWSAMWLMDRRAALRVRLEIEQMGGGVQTEPGPAWLPDVVDPRYFERVVALRVDGRNRLPLDPAWITSFGELEVASIYNIKLSTEDTQCLRGSPLRELHLLNNRLEGPELRSLAEMPNLEVLRLGQINDGVLPYLAGCNKLRLLRIVSSQKIAKAQKVDESTFELTDEGLLELPHLASLKELRLIRTATTEEGVRRLRERFPALEILHHNND